MMSLATVSNIWSVIPEPSHQIYFTRGLNCLQDVSTLFDNSINVFRVMVFAAN